jgi:hypothetical protein
VHEFPHNIDEMPRLYASKSDLPITQNGQPEPEDEFVDNAPNLI